MQIVRRLLLAVAIAVSAVSGFSATAAVACHDNAEEHWEWQDEWGTAYPAGSPVYDEPIGDPWPWEQINDDPPQWQDPWWD